jgi:hypothetical protein
MDVDLLSLLGIEPFEKLFDTGVDGRLVVTQGT